MLVIPELVGGVGELLGFASLIGGLQANMHTHAHARTPVYPPAHMRAHTTPMAQHLNAPSSERATDTIYSEASWEQIHQ